RRLSIAVTRYAARTVKQGKISLFLGQRGQQVCERGKNGQAHTPTVTIVRAEQCDLTDGVRGWDAGGKLSVDRLGDHKAEVVGKALVQASVPMGCRVGMAERGLHPYVQVAHFDGTGRHVIGPQIEGATAREIETSIVPVARQDAVLDAAAVERK